MAKRRDTKSAEKEEKVEESAEEEVAEEEKAEAKEEKKAEAKEEKKAEAKEEEKKEEEKKAEAKEEKPARTPEEQLERGKAWFAALFEKMKLNLDVVAKIEDDNFVFNLSGADADELIGRSRQSPRVLTSIQTLLTEHLGRETRGSVVVDLGGFKQQRQEHLVKVAEHLGQTSRRIGKAITVAGFNSYERRVIHQHLADADDLDTKSVDHGIFRKLQVYPD